MHQLITVIIYVLNTDFLFIIPKVIRPILSILYRNKEPRVYIVRYEYAKWQTQSWV